VSNFRTVDRGTAYLLPPSVDEWLPADSLARFVVQIVEQSGPDDERRNQLRPRPDAHVPERQSDRLIVEVTVVTPGMPVSG
jgi:hypothetical protein